MIEPLKLPERSARTGGASPPVPSCRRRSRSVKHLAASLVLSLLCLGFAGCAQRMTNGSLQGPLSGTFNYTKTEGAFLLGGPGRYEVLVPQTREIWIGRDGSGRLRTTLEPPIFFGEKDRAEWQRDPKTLQKRTDDKTALTGFSYIDLRGLPNDPGALLKKILGGLDPSDAGTGPAYWEVFIAAHGILWETVAPPELSMAVLVAMNGLLGIEVKEHDVDLQGRPGTRFSATSPGGQFRSVMWLDPVAGTLLGEQEELLMPTASIDATPPVVIKRASYLVSEVVNTTGDR